MAFTGILGTNLGEFKTHTHLNLQASIRFHTSLPLFKDEFWKGDFYLVLPWSQRAILLLEDILHPPQQNVCKFGGRLEGLPWAGVS